MNKDQNAPRGLFSLTAKAVAVLSLLLLAANLLLGGVLVYQSRDTMRSLLEQRMLDVSNTAAAMLDGDSLEKLRAEDRDTPPYQDALTKLRFFQDNIQFNLKYIYGIRDMGDGTFTFTIDPTVADPGEFGEPIVVTDALRAAAKGKPCVDETPYEDKWGRFYSAYSPVFNSHGKVAGIVAVDLDAAWFESQTSRQSHAIIVSCIASLILGGVIVFFLTVRIRRRFSALSADVNRLAGGIDELMDELPLPEDGHACQAKQAPAAGPDGGAPFTSPHALPETSATSATPAASGSGTPQGAPAPSGKAAKASKASGDEIGILAGRVRAMRRRVQDYLRSSQNQALSMIAALSADYHAVYFVDLAKDTGVCYRADRNKTGLREGEAFPFRKTIEAYAESFVAEFYRKGFLRLFDPGRLREASRLSPVATYRYLSVDEAGRESYELLRVAFTGPETIGMSLSDVDAETRRAMEQSQALREALATAQEASRAKTAFLSSMSHEIRTPMNAIIGLDSIALSEPDLPASTRSHLERIGSSARHLLGLINDILDMSRIESGRLTLASDEFSLPSLLEEVNAIIGGQCREKGLEYRCELRNRLRDHYVGDGMKLKQVLINILGNAVKFTPAGGSVSLEAEETASFGGRATLRFVISDTGIGIDEAFLPKLFKPFSQEDGSATTRYGSTGLGLAITRNIVELMSGTIEVESSKGMGSVFTVTVTLGESGRIVAGAGGFDPASLKVLVVDGDPDACPQAVGALAEAGVRADTAATGPEAEEKLRRRAGDPYELVFVDWKACGMSGMADVRQIRAAAGEDAVILLAAERWDSSREEAVLAGADGFVVKPLFAGATLEEFRKAKAARRGVQEGGEEPDALRGRRILLAEDNEINAEIMLSLLQMRGMAVDVAENGRICLDLFREKPEGHYDAILMDMRMPEMDGLETARAIRALDRPDAGSIPIIALTANAFSEDVANSLQSGLNAHLSKPVEPERLYTTLASFLAR